MQASFLKITLFFFLVISGLSLRAQTVPIAVDDSVKMCVGTASTINILANDFDPDAGEVLETDILSGPSSPLIDYEDGDVEGDYTILVDPEFTGDDVMVYQVCGDDGLCAIGEIIIIVAGEAGCVWPGDANVDSISNYIDLLPIGIYYGLTGPDRDDDDGTWEQSFCDNWEDPIGSDINPNPKFADCNGDGIINSADTIPIVNNYGQDHGIYEPEFVLGGADDPLLSLDIFTDTIEAGSEVVIPLKLGTDLIPASNIYGLSFRLDYDESLIVPGSIRVTFNSGWLGTPGTDLLSLIYNDTITGILDVAATRTNQLAISGNGNIGEVSFVMEDNIAGKTAEDFSTVLKFCLIEPYTVNSTGDPVPVNIACDSAIAFQLDDAIDNNSIRQILIAPNPADEYCIIQAGGNNNRIELLNIFGQIIFATDQFDESVKINTVDFPAGTYIISVRNQSGVSTRSVIIQH